MRVDKIGSSYIALPDLIIWAVAIALYYYLNRLPPNGLLCRVLAVLCGCIIAAIILVILLTNNLTSNGVHELSVIGMGLAVGVLQWNRGRLKSRPALANPTL